MLFISFNRRGGGQNKLGGGKKEFLGRGHPGFLNVPARELCSVRLRKSVWIDLFSVLLKNSAK